MKRRDFLKNAALGSIILGINPSMMAQQNFPDLAVIHGDSPSKITREAVASLGGIKRFVSKGDVVMLKANIGWDRTPEQAACTNPEVVGTLVELCLEGGAKEVKVMDNPCNPARRTYARSGIASSAKKAGATVFYPNKYRLRKMMLNGEWIKEWEVYSDFIEADKIINIPIAKIHSLSKLTMGMKNWLGALGGNRNQLHQNINAAMVDLSAFFKPCLTVLDAYRLLIRNGPQGGRLSDVRIYKTVVAGTDYVAVDTMGATFFSIKSEELPFLQLASQNGDGEVHLEKLRIEKRKV